MSKFDKEGCYNCKHAILDMLLSSDLLDCKLHNAAHFYFKSWCSEWTKMGGGS